MTFIAVALFALAGCSEESEQGNPVQDAAGIDNNTFYPDSGATVDAAVLRARQRRQFT